MEKNTVLHVTITINSSMEEKKRYYSDDENRWTAMHERSRKPNGNVLEVDFRY